MTTDITIWHHSKCSTSKKVLTFLEGTGKNIIIRDYLAHPPSIQELKKVLKMMGQQPEYILRKKNKVYQELFADKNLTGDACLDAMEKHPSIIERPIVIVENKAYLARPFDEFVTLFEKK